MYKPISYYFHLAIALFTGQNILKITVKYPYPGTVAIA